MVFVETGHFPRIDQVNSEVEILYFQQLVKQVPYQAPEQSHLDGPGALPVPQAQLAAHPPLPRCSSYAAIMRWTSGCRTMSRLLNSTMAMPSVCFKARWASTRPEC